MEGNEFWRLETPKTVSLSVCSSIHVKCSQHDGGPSGKGRGPSFRVLFQSANIPLWSIGKGSHRSEALCSHLQVGRSPHRPLCTACATLSRLLGLLYTERPQGAWEEKSHREQWHGLYGTGSQNTSCTFWVLCTTKPRAKRGGAQWPKENDFHWVAALPQKGEQRVVLETQGGDAGVPLTLPSPKFWPIPLWHLS